MRTITRIIPVVVLFLMLFGMMLEMSAYISAFKPVVPAGGKAGFIVVPAGNPMPFWGIIYTVLVTVLLGMRSTFVKFFDKDDFSKYSLGSKVSSVLSTLLGWMVFVSFWAVAMVFAGYGAKNDGYWMFIVFVLGYMVSKRISKKILLSKGYTCKKFPVPQPHL